MPLTEQPGAGSVSDPTRALLRVEGLRAGYRGRDVLFGVDLAVAPGEIVTLLGHNGAGKTTTLRTIFGLMRPSAGRVVCAEIELTGQPPLTSITAGMSFTPSEKFIFSELSVSDNLDLGAMLVPARERAARIKEICERFPILRDRRNQVAGTMSGGEQRMLSLGIALLTRPGLMLLDEPSLGLAPNLADRVMDLLRDLARDTGIAILLVEQNIAQALRHADRAYVMRSGEIILETSAAELRARGSWWDLF